MARDRQSRILIVEDERITALDIHDRLVRLGYGVAATVSSGEDAIACAVELHPDLVLMDIVLKGPLDGVQAAGQIRSRFNIPVVYLTAFSDSSTLQRAKVTEPFGYVLKPFEERDLQATIEMALYKHTMEEKLRESEREKTLILDSTADVVLYHDLDLKIRWANKTAGTAFHGIPEKLKGQYCFEIWRGKNSPCEGCPVAMARDTAQNQEAEIMGRDGRSWFVRAYPITDDSGKVTGVVEFRLDVTRQKHLEQQLRQAQKMESIGTLVAGISHDFNNVLNNVLGFAYQMRKYSRDESKVTRYTDMIEKSAARGAELANQLSSLVRLKKRDDKPLDICALIDEVTTLMTGTFPKSVSVSAARANDPVMVVGNHDELYQVLLNLCLNAQEAMPRGGSLILKGGSCVVGEEINQAVVPSAILQGRQCAYMRVHDTGEGIPQKDRTRIFDPFFTTKDHGRGTGLGLSVVYNIVKNHKGTILVDSSEGSGSAFTIYLPLAEGHHQEQRQAGSSQPATPSRSRILLVDDEAAMIELGKELLESEGYDVLTASDGLQATEIYRKQWKEVDLVVLDLVMPKLDGGQAFLEMKKINPEIKAFFCTGYSTDQVITSLLAEEHLCAIQKPFRPKEFIKLVKEMMLQ